ncbi:uncharacterized protein [Parasteatoda tepidariorum]|uniref:uncharacterized protein n=1 Tax=Parasteatoda tepidariorum TaxID=114398 RepID=UPI0039BCDC1D
MYSKFIFLFLLIAVGKIQAERCSSVVIKTREQECLRSMLERLIDEPSDAEVCQIARTTENCLRSLADDCLDESEIAQLEDTFHGIEALTQNCPETAVGKTQAERCSSEVIETRGRECIDSMLVRLKKERSEAEVCQMARTGNSCLRSLAEDCLDESDRTQLDDALQEIDALTENCRETETNEIDDETNEVCIQDNKDYILGCLRENQMRALSHFSRQRNPNENDVKCTVYNWMADCGIERVIEKCGAGAGDEMREELNNPPTEIKEACLAVNRPLRIRAPRF